MATLVQHFENNILSEPQKEIFMKSDYEEFLAALSQLIEINAEKSLVKEGLIPSIELLRCLLLKEKLEKSVWKCSRGQSEGKI